MKLLYNVFKDGKRIGRVWVAWGVDEEATIRAEGIQFHLAMDLIEQDGNKRVYKVVQWR